MAETHSNDNLGDGKVPKSPETDEDKQTSLGTSGSVPAEPSTPQVVIRERDPREVLFDKSLIGLSLIILLLFPLIIIVIKSTSPGPERLIYRIIALLIIAALIVWRIPKRQVSFLKNVSDDVRFTLENDARKTLAQILAGVFLLAGIYGTFRTMEVSEGEQLAERFSKGVERLASEKRPVRIGGIYALVSLAKESDKYKPDIRDLFIEFIRERASYNDQARTQDKLTQETELSPTANINLAPNVSNESLRNNQDAVKYTREIAIIVEFLGDPNARIASVDLSKISIKDLNCSRGNYEKWNFSSAHLERAQFISSELSSAVFKEAHLKDANFGFADLSYANFNNAKDLSGVKFQWANLEGARFDNTDLSSANFEGADLRDAELSFARGLTIEQILTARNYKDAKVSKELGSQIAKLKQEAIDLRNSPTPSPTN